MEHKHSVYDTDSHFMIDGVTRAVKNASQTKTMLVQNDHNSERFTFEIDKRYIDGHDLSLCNKVQVHFINIDSQTAKTEEPLVNTGVYVVDDIQVSPEDENIVICSWLIAQSATRLVGSLNFMIRFACVSDDGTVEYAWNTLPHTGVYISAGINADESFEEDYSDIIEKWKESVFEELKKDLPKAFDDLISPDGTVSVVRVRDTNDGNDVTFWVGTKAQYDALDRVIDNCIYIITGDATIDAIKTRLDGISDHIISNFEDVDFRNVMRKYESGTAEGVFKSVLNGLSFTTEHNGFYSLDSGRQRINLEGVMLGTIPEFCTINITKATMINDAGEETFAPPIFAMVCGKSEYLEGVGVVSPRFLLLADERAENVNMELEIHCRWNWRGDN